MQNKNFFINMAFELAKINLGSTKNPSVDVLLKRIRLFYRQDTLL